MPTGLARTVELARALATAPKLLLLDEPSSGLSEEETVFFSALLKSLTAEGLGILMVEHDVELVMDVCERIHVLDFGRKIAAGTPAEIQSDKAVQAAYLGAEGTGDAA
jgi:branched-chain amino acid transport system ATP-binding protein